MNSTEGEGEGTEHAAPKTGYKSPPDEHKFKKGKSGNPKGRPKKVKSAGDIWLKVAQAECELVIGGKKKKMMRIEAVVTTVMAKAMKGDQKAAQTVVQAYQLYGPVHDIDAKPASADADKAALTHLLSKLLPGGEGHA